MKTVNFEYRIVSESSSTIYKAINEKRILVTVPTVFALSDNWSLVCVPGSIAPTSSPHTFLVGSQCVQPTVVPVLETKVSISENALLKAIAITKDATLALQLIKD